MSRYAEPPPDAMKFAALTALLIEAINGKSKPPELKAAEIRDIVQCAKNLDECARRLRLPQDQTVGALARLVHSDRSLPTTRGMKPLASATIRFFALKVLLNAAVAETGDGADLGVDEKQFLRLLMAGETAPAIAKALGWTLDEVLGQLLCLQHGIDYSKRVQDDDE